MEVFSFLPMIIVIVALSTVSSLMKRKAAETAKKSSKTPAAPRTLPYDLPLPEPEEQPWQPEQPLVVAPAEPKMGVEGADDCHAYMLPSKRTVSIPEPSESDENPQAQELLRGVILSEILGCPEKRYRRRV